MRISDWSSDVCSSDLGADDGRAEVLRPLAGDETDPAGGGVDQNGHALPDPEGRPQQVLDGQTLEHNRRRLVVAGLMVWKARQPVLDGLDARAERIRAELDEAQRQIGRANV